MSEGLSVSRSPREEISFSNRIMAWQNLLDNMPESDPTREGFEQKALQDLHDKWRYQGEECIFFGKICLGIMSQVDDKVWYATPGIADETPGTSDGFGIFTFIDDGAPRKKFAYVLRAESKSATEVENNSEVEHITQVIYALDPANSRILFSSDFENTLDLHSLVQQRSDELVAFMRSPYFLIMHAKEQQAVIDQCVMQTWQHMNILLPGVQNLLCEGSQAYALKPTKRAVLQFKPITIEDTIIEGNLAGFEVLETQQLAEGKALRHPSEFINEQAGLCLTVIPNEATARQLGLVLGADLLYIPISCQELEVVFGQESINAT